MKYAIFIQARLNSSRLPKKVKLKIYGKTILEHIVSRLKKSNKINEIFILTSRKKIDNEIEQISKKCGIRIFRGSENDVLSRFYFASIKYKVDHIIRCNADCPLLDHRVLDKMINYYNKNLSIDYLSNILEQSYPVGMHIEIFNKKVLHDAHLHCKSMRRREHVTPYIYNNKKYKIKNYKSKKNLSNHRWTLDYYEDYLFTKKIYSHLYKKNQYFSMNDVIRLLDNNPHLKNINYQIVKKNNRIY